MAGYRVQSTGHRVQGTGYRIQGTGYRAQGIGYRVQGTEYRVWGTGYSPAMSTNSNLRPTSHLSVVMASDPGRITADSAADSSGNL
jgi:hypothetical protein